MRPVTAPTNTFLERLAIDGAVNLSDGHARQPLFSREAEIVADFGRYYDQAARCTQTAAERCFSDAFFRLSGEPQGHSTLFSYSASSLIAVAATWLREQGIGVALFEPGFDNIRDLLVRAGVHIRPIGGGPTLRVAETPRQSSLGNAISALWLTLPNNPDGFELSFEDFSRLAAWCAEESVLLVCDFCFRLFSTAMSSWSQYEALARSGCRYIAFEDTGKTFPLFDLKIGMLRCSPQIEAELRVLNEEVILNVSPWLAMVLADVAAVYESEGLHEVVWVPTGRRSQIVEDWIAEVAFSDAGNPAGNPPFKWIRIPDGMPFDAPTLARRAADEGVHLLPGERFFFDESKGSKFFRVPLNRPDDLIKTGLSQVSEIVGRHR